LEGKKKSLIKIMENQMREAASQKKYEEAAQFRDKIKSLEYIIQKRGLTESFLEDFSNRTSGELQSTFLFLKKNFEKLGFGIIRPLKRIEAYDVSNIMGSKATASMVVFENGIAKKEDYRRFRIKTVRGINDVAMLKEVFTRRFRRIGSKKGSWPLPNLVLIDGGKPQVGAVLDVILPLGLKIPVLGLAKKEETIILPFFINGRLKFKELRLKKMSKVLNFFKRLRDEAHRFARKYHLYLRKSSLTAKVCYSKMN
jgi:excinuclease ABC subunit C